MQQIAESFVRALQRVGFADADLHEIILLALRVGFNALVVPRAIGFPRGAALGLRGPALRSAHA